MFGEPVFQIGCDVGSLGAFAILNVHTEELQLVPIPSKKVPIAQPTGKMQKETVYNPQDFLDLLRPMTFKASMIKEVQKVYRGESPWAAAKLHRCDAIIETAAAASLIPLEQVDPTSWKSCIMRGRGGKSATKPACVAMAKALFPAAADVIQGDFREGMADALLLLYYKLLGPKIHDTRAVFNPVRCQLVTDTHSQMRLAL